jgi:murein DD-endopeptidase MepM/ murein hydrolase activator NlpD
MRTQRSRFFAGLLLALLAAPAARAAAPAAPPPPPAPEGLDTGWHIVRPGDTLEQITARYLGSARLWRRNAQLNPDIADPNHLTPGQRIRIYVPRQRGTPAAQVTKLSRKVEAQASPIPWEDARLGDLLIERDGVRTYPKSSAEMAFLDGTRLMVTEDSLVFLQRTGGALHGVERKAVEIVQGQADFEGRPKAGRSEAQQQAEVEIVLGSTRATARTDRSGNVQTRARRAEEGGARLMAYGGEADVEAGGAKVQVPQGMGTSVAASGPPSPPEKLLPAPRALSPAGAAEAACANPALAWEPVPDAAAYVVEVCRDAECGSLVERAVGVAGPEWRPQALPAAELWWRVTARSRSGLDGYPGTARKLTVTSDHADAQLPAGVITLAGPQVRVGETLFAGPGAHLEVATTDDDSGPAGWRPVINGKESDSLPAGPWAAGVYTAGAVALDRCGNRGPAAPLSFTVDATPPGLTWDVVEYDAFAGRGAKARKARSAPLTWSGGAQWLPLATGEEIRIDSDTPQAFFHAAGARFAADGREVTLGDGQMLRLRAQDSESLVEHLLFRLRPAAGGGLTLEIETGDLVGNVRRAAWELRR